MSVSVLSYIQSISQQLMPLYSSVEQQEQIAWWLLEFVTQKKRALLLIDDLFSLSDEQEKQLNKLISEHVQEHKPLQYIFGSVAFAGLTLAVRPPVHIPRPETEEWIIKLIEQLKKLPGQTIQILDMCSGSGCIALACAYHLPEATIVGADYSHDAITLSQENAKKNNIQNVSFYYSNLFEGVPKNYTFDLIVSNPPYVSQAEWEALSSSVRTWEDKYALVAKDEGYALLKEIIDSAPQWLSHNEYLKEQAIPQLVLEMSAYQTEVVAAYLEKNGWYDVRTEKDYAGLERIVQGRYT